VSNLKCKFAGSTDVQLTDLGKKQGKFTGEFLKSEKIDAIYSMIFQDEKELPINLNQEVDDSVFKLEEKKEENVNEITEENSIN
jgi:broad specificity phosphatase PhoE